MTLFNSNFIHKIGVGAGPILGSILYRLVGFIYLFLIFGLFHLVYIPLMALVMPKDMDSDNTDTKNLVKDVDKEKSDGAQAVSDISLCKLLSNPLIIMCSIAEFVGYIAFSYFEPLLSFRVAELTDSTFIQGLMFSLLVAGMSIMALIIPLLSKLMSHVHMISVGLFLCGLSNFFVGPSILLPNSLILMGFGLFFSGFTMMFGSVPQLPFMINLTEEMYPSETRKASDL